MTYQGIISVASRSCLFAAALLVALVAPASAGAESEFAQPGAIEGVVTLAPKGIPIEGVEICATGYVEEENVNQCAISHAHGSYEVIGLPEGKYRVRFSSGESGRKLVPEYYRNAATFAAAKVLQVNERQDITGINAELQPAASGVGAVRHPGHHKHHKHHHDPSS